MWTGAQAQTDASWAPGHAEPDGSGHDWVWQAPSMRVVLVQMRKEMEAGQWRGMDKDKAAQDQAAGQGSAKVAPKPYMSAQYKEDTMRTTGNATSPDAATAHEPT